MDNQQKIENYIRWCVRHEIINEDRETENTGFNASLVAQFMERTGQTEWTPDALDKAFEVLKPKLRLYSSTAEAKYGNLSNELTAAEHDTVNSWAAHQNRLVTDGADGAANKRNIITWLQSKNMPITVQNLSLALSNIVNNGHLGYAPLVWKRVEQKTQEREVSDAEIATWRSRAEGAVVRSPQGHILQTKTAAVQAIFVKNDKGEVDWRQTYLARERAAERRS